MNVHQRLLSLRIPHFPAIYYHNNQFKDVFGNIPFRSRGDSPSSSQHPVSSFQAGVFAKTASLPFYLLEAAMSRLKQAAKTLRIPRMRS